MADEGRHLSITSDPNGPIGEPVPEFAHRVARKKRRRIFSIKRVLLKLLGLFLLGALAVGVAFAKVSVPQPNDLAAAQASIIY